MIGVVATIGAAPIPHEEQNWKNRKKAHGYLRTPKHPATLLILAMTGTPSLLIVGQGVA